MNPEDEVTEESAEKPVEESASAEPELAENAGDEESPPEKDE